MSSSTLSNSGAGGQNEQMVRENTRVYVNMARAAQKIVPRRPFRFRMENDDSDDNDGRRGVEVGRLLEARSGQEEDARENLCLSGSGGEDRRCVDAGENASSGLKGNASSPR